MIKYKKQWEGEHPPTAEAEWIVIAAAFPHLLNAGVVFGGTRWRVACS
jgi:hypothetical protein